MLQHEIIISTDLGKEECFHPNAIRRILEDFQYLQHKLPLKISLCLGNRAENFMLHLGDLEELDLHFKLPSNSLLEHCQDAILQSPHPCFIQTWQTAAPLPLWEQWMHFSEQLYSHIPEKDNLGFYRFHSSSGELFPYLIHPEGKAQLRTLFREGNTQKVRDFDWRKAKFVAKSSFNKTDFLTQRA